MCGRTARSYSNAHKLFDCLNGIFNYSMYVPNMILFDTLRLRHIYECTYPHSSETYFLIVPKRLKMKSNFFKFFTESPLVLIWVFAIILFTILRSFFRKCAQQFPIVISFSMQSILFDSIGLIMGSGGGTRVTNRPEQQLVAVISVFALLSGILFSEYVFQQFTDVKTWKLTQYVYIFPESKLPLLSLNDHDIFRVVKKRIGWVH